MNLRESILERSGEELNEAKISSFARKIATAFTTGKAMGKETAELINQGYSLASAKEIIKITNILEKASKAIELIEKRTTEENR